MTDSLDHGPDLDDRPHTTPAPAPAAPVPYRPRPSRTARVFRWWLGLSIVAFCGVMLCVLLGFNHADYAPLHIVVDGDDLTDGITINGLTEGGRLLLAFGAAMLALLLLLLIPIVLLLVVGSVAIALVCGIGVPLVVLALALGVATSPFWIVGVLIWLVVRRRRDSQRLAPSATMAA
jgi:hypothetical protein